MKKKSNNPHQLIWKASFLLGLLTLALGLAWPVLADYLGPDRTVTTWTWERLHCEYFAMYDPPGSGYYGCYLHLYDTPSGSCPPTSSTPPYFNPTACVGWPGTCGVDFSCSISLSSSIDGCTQGQLGCTSTAHTVTYPSATVSGSVNCSQMGDDGWCVGTSSLTLSANEPVGGNSILLIEGTRNGETFACPGSSCNVPLIEGQNDFAFWALSSWGDSSLMGASSGKVDSQPPQVSLSGPSSFCPGCGESLNVTLSVSDATSGVTSWTLNLDGAPLTGGSGSASQTVPVPSAGLSAGSHTLSLSASDIAGNVNATSLTFTLLLPTPTPTFTPVPSSTPVPAQPGHPPAGQPSSQPGSSVPLVQGTPTSLTATPTVTSTTQPGGLLIVPAVPSDQDGDVSDGDSVITGQQQPTAMPPDLLDNVIWGAAAAAAIGTATAYVLEQQKRRKEEEALARAEAERANVEARAREQAQREYQAALKAAEAAQLKQEADMRFLETADMSEAEKLALYKQTPEYQAYRARVIEWEQQQTSMQAIEQADMTEAERLAAYEQTPEYKAYQARMAEWETQQQSVAKEVQTQESWLQTAWNWTYNNLISPPIEWAQQTIIQPFLQNVPPQVRKAVAIMTAISLTTILAYCAHETISIPTPNANATRTSAFQTKAAETAYVLSLTPTLDPCSEGYCIGQTYYAGERINLRSSPAGELVGSLGCGDSITIIGGFERKPLNEENHLWAQVDSSIGLAGVWIAIDLFSPTDQEPMDCYVGNRTEEEGYIATDGDGFTVSDIEAIGQGGDNIADAFARVLGMGYSPEEAWNLVFQDTTITFVDTGLDCYNMGIRYFQDYGFDSKCWAAAGAEGYVYVSTEFTDEPHSANEVVEWASHETGHEVDRLISNEYGYIYLGVDENGDPIYEYYGAYQMTLFEGGISAASDAIPTEFRQSAHADRDIPVEVFADAFNCWSNSSCEFTDPEFEEFFNNLIMEFIIDRANP